jgi:catechol 2,3-dioxygenase-like lactoylglutathione lyase family enzyme
LAEGIGAQRVDFIAVPTRDRERAAQFYGETLGLERNPNSTDQWIEFETGNVTLAIVAPEEMGIEFQSLPFGAIALRVPDVEAAKTRLRDAGVEFRGETWDSGVCNGASFADPDGNGLLIHHRYAPYLDGSQP